MNKFVFSKICWIISGLFILAFAVWFFGVSNDVLAKSGQPKAAFAVLQRTDWDFGTVDNDSILTATFPIKNAGGSRLIVHQRKSSCECIVADQDPIILKPGESTELVAKLNTHKLDGSFAMELDYQTSARNLPKFKLIVSCQVQHFPRSSIDMVAKTNDP